MKKLLLATATVSLFLCTSPPINAQTYVNMEWVQIHGAPDTIRWSTSTLDTWGQLITVGNTVTTGQHANILTVQYDGEGTINWQREWNGPQNSSDYGSAVITDGNGYIYVAGAGRYTTDSTFDIILLKYDHEGYLQWDAYFNSGAGQNDIPTSIALDNQGNIYLTGTSERPSTSYDFVTLKFNESGNLQWATLYDYNNLVDIAASIVVSGDGEEITVMGGSERTLGAWDYTTVLYDASGFQVSVARQSSDETDIKKPKDLVKDDEKNYFITGIQHNGSDYDVKLMKLDSTLQLVWVEVYDEGHSEGSNTLAMDENGNLFIGGWVEVTPGVRHFLVLKYDNDGALQWNRTIEPIETKPLAEVTGLLISGSYINIVGIASNSYSSDIITAQMDMDGEILWIKIWEGMGNTINVPTSITASSDEDAVYVTGQTTGANGTQWATIKYSYHHRSFVVYTDTNGMKFRPNELLIQFDPAVMKYDAVDDLDKTFGLLSEFVQDSVIDAMKEKLDTDFEDVLAFKVFRRFTSGDSLSVTRLGDTIKIHHVWTTMRVVMPDNEMDEIEAALQLHALYPNIYFAEPNLIIESFDLPNDTEFTGGNQVGLEGDPDNDIQMDRAWDIYHGSPSVRVGVYDNGIQWSHEDFGNGTFPGSKIVNGFDYHNRRHIRDMPNQGIYGANNPHGTQVAGIIGAIRNNNRGVAGIAGGNQANNNTGCALYGFQIFSGTEPDLGLISNAADALYEGAVQFGNWGFGLHVLNCSWGIYTGAVQFTQNNRNIMYRVNRDVFRNHAVLVYGIGNRDDNQPTMPASIGPDEFMISVGASGMNGARATGIPFGNVTWGSNFGNNIDIIAPGVVDLITTTGLNNSYVPFSGTSAAAPHVSGVAALMISYVMDHPTPNKLAPEDVEHLLETYITDIDEPSPPYQVGYDEQSGWGRLNAGMVMEHLEWPFYKVMHVEATVSASNAVLVHQDVARDFDFGEALVDVYELTASITHNIGNYTLIDSWRRNSSSDLYANTNPMVFEVDSELFNVTNSGAQMRGYIYHLKSWLSINPPWPLNIWEPFDLSSNARFAYSLHLHDPNATGIGLFESERPQVTIYPNPTGNSQVIGFVLHQDSEVVIDILDITGRIIGTVFSGRLKGKQQIPADLSSLSPGLYFYRIVIDGETAIVSKTIKQ